MNKPSTTLLLNVGHAIVHMFLLIFATAVTTIALEFGLDRWEDLMPYSAAAFFFFGIGALPAGRLGDHWGRRAMMIVFFVGMGASAIVVSLVQTPLQLALALAMLGCFAAIYHPVGIPMLLQGSKRPGWVIGVNGFSGNLGVALAAVVTGFLVKEFGWRAAFAGPGILSLALGIAFWLTATEESLPPAKRKATQVELPRALLARVFLVMTLAATSASLLFNFSTNGNYELLHERLGDTWRDPAKLGLLLGAVYAVASVAQLVVGRMLDRFDLKSFTSSCSPSRSPSSRSRRTPRAGRSTRFSSSS
jgi:MFS family permease